MICAREGVNNMTAIHAGIMAIVCFAVVIATFALLGSFFPKQPKSWKNFFQSNNFKG